MSYTYQCGHRKCRQRYRFKQPLERYVRVPKGLVRASLKVRGDYMCGRCRKGALNPTGAFIRKYERERPDNPARCECGGLPYPHREGSCDRRRGLFCLAHPEAWEC